VLEKGISFGLNGGLDRLDMLENSKNIGFRTASMGCSDREPDTGSVFSTSVEEISALSI
jgi:hypothetical protein